MLTSEILKEKNSHSNRFLSVQLVGMQSVYLLVIFGSGDKKMTEKATAVLAETWDLILKQQDFDKYLTAFTDSSTGIPALILASALSGWLNTSSHKKSDEFKKILLDKFVNLIIMSKTKIRPNIIKVFQCY